MSKKVKRIGIDAARLRSGGAVAHILGILNNIPSELSEKIEIILWTYPELGKKVEDLCLECVEVRCPAMLKRGAIGSRLWQLLILRYSFLFSGCDILYLMDASSPSSGCPTIVFPQDMQAFTPGVSESYKSLVKKARLFAIKRLQISQVKRAKAVVHLNRYSESVYRSHGACNTNSAIIPHGVDERYGEIEEPSRNIADSCLRLLYISNLAPYKNQDVVVEAVRDLYHSGMRLKLDLVGGGEGAYYEVVKGKIRDGTSFKEAVSIHPFITSGEVIDLYRKSAVILFMSSCETMPVTLLEGMLSGLPLICSDIEPMREISRGMCRLCDPTSADSIREAIREVSSNYDSYCHIASRARDVVRDMTWASCGDKTWRFIYNNA